MRAKILGVVATLLRVTIFIDERRYGARPLHIGEIDTR